MCGRGFDDRNLPLGARRKLRAGRPQIDRLGRLVAGGEFNCRFGDAGGIGQIGHAGPLVVICFAGNLEQAVGAGAQNQASRRHEAWGILVANGARRHDCRSVGRPGGKIEFSPPGVDQAGDGAPVGIVADVEPDCLQAGEAADGSAERKLQPARQRKSDANPGKGAGSDGDGDAVYLGKLHAAAAEHALHHADERLGMAARHRLEGVRQQAASAGIEDGRGTGAERRVKGENEHRGRGQLLAETTTRLISR